MGAEGATGRYSRIEIPLDAAKTDELIEIYGDYIGVGLVFFVYEFNSSCYSYDFCQCLRYIAFYTG